jgi:hypothetical protein
MWEEGWVHFISTAAAQVLAVLIVEDFLIGRPGVELTAR